MGDLNFRLVSKSLSALQFHPVETIDHLHPRKLVLRVRNHHFTALNVDCFTPGESATGNHRDFLMHEADRDDVKRFKEGIQTALYTLYVLNIPHGECVVQRESAHDYSVYSVLPLRRSIKADTKSQQIPLTFGADVECLLQNRKTGCWVAASSITAADGAIGYDEAIAIKKNKVQHPILELRPEPATSGVQLHDNLLILYEKLERYLKKNHLRAVGKGFDRFYTGGHLHVGNQPFTFRHIRNLDIFLALPFALTEAGHPQARRQRYGRLGSVLPNNFCGFEYRVLPSWYELIPDLKPVLEWFSYINRHSGFFSPLDLTTEMLRGYYLHSISDLSKVLETTEEICRHSLPNEDFSVFAAPFFRLIREKARSGEQCTREDTNSM